MLIVRKNTFVVSTTAKGMEGFGKIAAKSVGRGVEKGPHSPGTRRVIRILFLYFRGHPMLQKVFYIFHGAIQPMLFYRHDRLCLDLHLFESMLPGNHVGSDAIFAVVEKNDHAIRVLRFAG